MKCINCGKKAVSFDGLWCLKCLGDEAIYPDDYPKLNPKELENVIIKKMAFV